ncbi:MAG: PaaI family thioesterase [Sphingorhabdus sp.]
MTASNTRSLPPYALALDMEASKQDGASPLITMPFGNKVQGRPGFLHGGAISGLLEMAAIAAIHTALAKQGDDAPIKQVNVTIDFMRGGKSETTYAAGVITRLGRTMANVSAHAWQDDPGSIIAQAQMHYLISRGKDGQEA